MRFGRRGTPAAAGGGSAADTLREFLYGDISLERWTTPSFDPARDALAAGDVDAARAALRSVLAAPDSGSRDCLQAWHQLRALGEVPDDPARLYGVVVDMPVNGGVDTLAAYQDGTARYVNYSGKVLVWDASHPQVDARIRSVIDVGAGIASLIGPWEGPRPALRPGMLRLSMLCAGGLRFGEGPMDALSADPMAGALLQAAGHLLQTLIEMDQGATRTS